MELGGHNTDITTSQGAINRAPTELGWQLLGLGPR